ncbi:pilus assembly protein [Zobellella denitrificans]|uniref:pilus assembly protein n=1 Tax=Zobellella denitrificans TaxID=347534 RepID=UPI000B8BC111|nr:pilus assembly protein [Zobellella denitrificans]OXS15038.1 pilus assembly protein [Zobellella denitrificans]
MLIAKELLRLVNDEDGLTTVEYAVAGALVSAAVVAAFFQLGNQVDNTIEELCTAVATTGSTVDCGAARP